MKNNNFYGYCLMASAAAGNRLTPEELKFLRDFLTPGTTRR